jgi:histidinol-phosphate aminotransferase
MTNAPRFTPLIASLPATVPFVGAEVMERASGYPFAARIGANENVFGPSPKAIAAMQAAAPEAWKYGDSASYDLRVAIAAHHGITVDHIVIGEGIDGLLGMLVRLIITHGDAVVTSDGAYPTLNYHVAGFGGVIHKVPFKDDHEDPDALIAKAKEVGAKLIYIANPDNPMGTHHRAEVIARMVDRVPEGTLLIVDEAYIDFAPQGTALDLPADDHRVIRMRTFSKAYALAGLRVGYAIGGKELIAGFDRVRNHFGMGNVAQAGALAAFQDSEWLGHVVGQVAKARDRIAAIAADNGLVAVPSATNFVCVDCGADGDFARKVLGGLLRRGLFVRMPFVAPQDRCIRISCGTENDLDLLAEALPDALAEARG